MNTKVKRSLSEVIFDYGNVLFMVGLITATLYPLLYIVFASFSDATQLAQHRGLLAGPLGFSTAAYQAVFEDWLFHVLLPLTSYVMLVVSAGVAYSHPRPALFLVCAAALPLLFIGIHNAWDTVTYHVFVKRHEQREDERY